MNNAPRLALRKIIAKYGHDLCGDRRRCEGLLKDLCGEFRREINVLTNAIEERVPLDLLAAKSTPRELLLTKLSKRLEDNLGLTKEAANWAVDSWALALGILTDAEVAEKEKNQSEILPPPPSTKPMQPTPAQNNRTVPPRNTPPQSPQNQPKPPPKIYPPSAQRSPQTLPNKPQTPKVYQPVARTPANVPMPAPKSPPQTNPNAHITQNPAQSNNSVATAAPKRRFGKFFGCLFVLFLLVATGVVLLFGVPYAIETMRETQRSEPRRFPSQ